ncbi:MAG: DUF262 domain-containing protein [Thermoplasmataceae archaeon]
MPNIMNSAFHAEPQSLIDLFGGPKSIFQVPDYQRPYSWKEDEIFTLFGDLQEAFENNEDEYFLGTMIFVDRDGVKEVVDGQQRLATLTVMNCVIRDFFMKYLPRGDEVEEIIIDSIVAMVGNKTRVRFAPGTREHIYFQSEIIDKLDLNRVKVNTKEWDKKPFLAAAKFLLDLLNEFLGTDAVRIKSFVNYLMNNVKVISISCSRRDFAIKLFTIVNNRGLDLYESDIFKSFLVGKAEQEGEEVRKGIVEKWNQFEKYVEDGDEYFGSLDDLLVNFTHYTLASNPEKSTSVELSSKFKDKKAHETMYELGQFIENWHSIWDSNERWSLPFYYLRDQRYWRSIVLTAKMSEFQPFDKLIFELRRMFFSYWIAGFYSSKIKQTCFNIIQKVKHNSGFTEIIDIIEKKMIEDKVIDKLDEALRDEVAGEKWIKPVLALLEYYENDANTQDFIEIYNKGVELEHILPGEWRNNSQWKVIWDEKEADHHLNRIGNLALISGPKNKSGSNEYFDVKKTKYLKSKDGKTRYLLTTEVFENNSQWTAIQVEERGKVLIDKIKRLLEKSSP